MILPEPPFSRLYKPSSFVDSVSKPGVPRDSDGCGRRVATRTADVTTDSESVGPDFETPPTHPRPARPPARAHSHEHSYKHSGQAQAGLQLT